MELIREIVVPENNRIDLTIPDNFIGKRIEVFAFEVEKSAKIPKSSKKKLLMRLN